MNQWISKLPIKTKLLLIIMLTSISSLILTGMMLVIYNNYQAKQALVKDITSIGMLIADRSTAALTFQDSRLAEENLSALNIKPAIVYACILNDRGAVFAKYATADGSVITSPANVKSPGYYFENKYLMISLPISLDGKSIGTVFLCTSLRELNQQQQNIMVLVIIIILFASIIAFFLSSRLQIFVSGPVLHLTETTRTIAQQKNFSIRASKSSDDEVGVLVGAFNEMLETIDSQNSEKKKLIDELRESRTMLNTILDTIPQAIFWKDCNSRYLGCNRAFSNLAGIGTPNEIIDKSDFDMPWTRKQSEGYLLDDQEVINSGEPKRHIIEHLKSAGGFDLWVDTTKIPLIDADGKVHAVLGVLEDITDRKNAEERILNANRVYAVISQINQAIVHIRSKDNLLHEACKIAVEYGKFQMAWIGLVDPETLSVKPFVFSGNEKGYLSTIKEISVSQEPEGNGPTGTAIREGRHFICNDIELDPQMKLWSNEALQRGYRSSIALPIKLGNEVIGSFNLYAAVPNFFSDAEVYLLDEVTTNISFALQALETETKRLHAAEALRQSEVRYKQLLGSITNYIYSVEVEKGKPVKTTHQQGCISVTGYSPLDFDKDSMLWLKMVHPDDQKMVEHYADPLLEGQQIQVLEHRIIHKNGSVIWIKNTYVLKRDADGKVIGYDGLISNITARKKVEEELILHRDHLEELVKQRTAELELEKEHAESADRIKSAFLATMSHELRTPLNSIIGFTGILMQERPGPLNIEQKKQLGMAQNSARHLLSLINDVLDISKIEAGQLKVNFEVCFIPEIILKVVESSKPLAQKKNLPIEVDINPDVNTIVSDKLRVQQILLNLVSNAIKFTEMGSIRIEACLKDQFVLIKVVDSGIGIEKDQMDQLFKPFIQIDTGLTRKHEGTGLGLSISKKLTNMLGGTIEVESVFGRGSVFFIRLPINRE